jgi:hypothetical protein
MVETNDCVVILGLVPTLCVVMHMILQSGMRSHAERGNELDVLSTGYFRNVVYLDDDDWQVDAIC